MFGALSLLLLKSHLKLMSKVQSVFRRWKTPSLWKGKTYNVLSVHRGNGIDW